MFLTWQRPRRDMLVLASFSGLSKGIHGDDILHLASAYRALSLVGSSHGIKQAGPVYDGR